MKALRDVASEVAGLFVEDRTFAVAIAIVIAIVGGLAATRYVPASVGGFVLFFGLALELVLSILTASRRALECGEDAIAERGRAERNV